MGPGALNAAQAATTANAGRLDFNRKSTARGAVVKMAAEALGIQAQSAGINTVFGTIPDAIKAVSTTAGAKEAGAALHKLATTITQPGGSLAAIEALQAAVRGLIWRTITHPFSAFTGPSAASALGGIPKVHVQGGSSPVNNPLNMKVLRNGVPVWAQYGSTDEGILGNAQRLSEFAKVWGIPNTMASIIRKWDPEGIGLSGEYAAHVEQWSGVSRNMPLDKMTQAQFAAVFSAMSRQEGTDPVSVQQVLRALSRQRQNVRPPTVVVKVSNPTQSRVSVSVKAAHP
jgi:hypothetical protein